MKKNLLVTAALSIVCLSVHAQPEKGNTFIGIGITAERTHHNMNSSFLVPKMGYFVNKHVAIGSSLFISAKIQPELFIYEVGLQPFARYYFFGNKRKENKRTFWFVEASTGFNRFSSKSLSPQSEHSYNYINYGIAGGFTYYLTPDVSIEGLLRFDGNKPMNGVRYVESRTFDFPNANFLKIAAEIGINFTLKGRKKSIQK